MPKKALTDAAVKRLKPPANGQVDYFDAGYPGLALRVSYGGGKSFVFFYRIGGKLRRMTLGAYRAPLEGEKEPPPRLGEPVSLSGARQLWRQAREDASAGRDPSTARSKKTGGTDFKTVSEEWLRRDQAKNRSYREAKRVVERELVPAWDLRHVSTIGRRDILDLVDGIVDRGSIIMARRVQAYIARFFKWCVWRGITEANPAADLQKPGAEVRRDRVLTEQELSFVWRVAGETEWPFGPIMQLLILTGARREEIGGLRWREIDGGEISLSGERTKNGEPHTIPLSKPALAIIGTVPRIAGSDYLFGEKRSPGRWDHAKKKLDAAVAELAGEPLPHWRVHDLRRTTATGLQRLGVTLQVIEAVLGHTSGSRSGIVSTYQRHSFHAEKAAALEAWGALVMSLLKGHSPGVVLPMRGKR